jgi:quercetin dioxygenase-like cupin family protein
MKKLVSGSAVLAGLAALVIAATALATNGSGLTSTTLAKGTLQPIDVKVKTGDWKTKLETKGTSDVIVTENRVAPGGNFGWHSHPGPSLVIVKSGTSTFYDGDDPTCTPHVYAAGSAYVDPGGDTHIARNEGTTELVIIVARLLPEGAPARIDQPAPGNCPF